jgi:hypothetical protein
VQLVAGFFFATGPFRVIYMRHSFAAIAVSLLIGCSHPISSAAVNVAIRIASAAARKRLPLADFDPRAPIINSRAMTGRGRYSGISGHHFSVWVDDRTRASRVMQENDDEVA